jgi:AraC-like DNA-binding protein
MERNLEGARAAALRLLSLLTPRAAAESARSCGGLAPWQKRKVDCYLREHLERPLPVKQVAQQVSLSVGHFCRAFKESFGTTPHTHIIRLRLERAQQLMSTTRDSLSHIALSCGLADQAHLSKLFRRWIGETPNGWRRQNFAGAQIDGRSRRSTESQEASPRLAA